MDSGANVRSAAGRIMPNVRGFSLLTSPTAFPPASSHANQVSSFPALVVVDISAKKGVLSLLFRFKPFPFVDSCAKCAQLPAG